MDNKTQNTQYLGQKTDLIVSQVMIQRRVDRKWDEGLRNTEQFTKHCILRRTVSTENQFNQQHQYNIILSNWLLIFLDTDVWFYALDPVEQKLLSANSPVTQDKLTGKQAQTSLKYIVTGDFHVQVYITYNVILNTVPEAGSYRSYWVYTGLRAAA